MSSSHMHPPAVIQTAATAVANALTASPKYALVGGGACVILGATRTTQDVDFVVLRGQTPAARQLLRASPHFNVEPRTNHTSFNAEGANGVEIEILAPPALFKKTSDQNTEVITVGNVKVLKPALILNAKCRSILDRPSESKKSTDASDIIFILGFCARNPMYLPKAAEVPNATREFVQMFIGQAGIKMLRLALGTICKLVGSPVLEIVDISQTLPLSHTYLAHQGDVPQNSRSHSSPCYCSAYSGIALLYSDMPIQRERWRFQGRTC